jgi:zinc protease
MSGQTRISLTLVSLLLLSAAVALSTTIAAPPDNKAPAKDDSPALRVASALYEGIRTETLDNGLKVYLKPIPGSPVVTTMVCYKVGSSDEDLDNTGLSHYLEHLMFKGTEKIKPGDIDRLTLRNGGANNAYTTNDLTNFHFDFAADRWEVALGVEADRMRNLRIDKEHEFEQEKGAVIEELKRNEDEPWDLEQKAILPLLFGKTTPYGHPVIGETQHVKDATDKIIKSHYDRWYHPNNASLVIVGGFDPDRAMTKIKELFGSIPRGKLPERKKLETVKIERPARKEFESKFEVARMVMGFNTIPSNHPDFAALAVLENILSGGKTGRLYKKLVEGEELCSAVDATHNPGRYPGWFGVSIEMLQGKDRTKAEKIVLEELKNVRDETVSDGELKRAKQGKLAGEVFARESVHGLADSIARGVTTNDLDYLKQYLPRILAVTAKDVQRVAKEYFDPEKRVTVWSVPPKGGQGAVPRGHEHQRFARAARAEGKTAGFSLRDARRVELPNGIVLLLFEDHRLPIVTAQASLRHVSVHEPDEKLGVAMLTGGLLDEGTDKTTGPKIAQLIEDVGGELALTANGGAVKVLSGDRALALRLLFECLSQANFPKEAFERNKQRQLSAIEEAESQPEAKSKREFYAAVYGKHPKGRPERGTKESVGKLTREDCAAFHKKVFVPNNLTVAVVGDFNSKDVIDEITRLTADWKKSDLPKVETPAVEKPKEFTQKIITMPDAAQLQFHMGHVGVTRKSPDYYKLLVMDYVLGTGPGFTDRLSSRLRDREGLAYTVNANISGTADLEPGVFACYIGTAPKNFDRVKKEFHEELNRIRDEKAKKAEVEDAKSFLIGNLPFRTTTSGDIAGQLLYIERHGLGFDYLDDYRKGVSAVTVEDVQEVAKKYIDPKRMVLVAAGAIDKDGKEIKKPSEKP